MEPTYTMIGADGAQYGPINLAQIRNWISEGRITAETKVLRSDNNAWLPASQYSELGLQPVFAGHAPAVATAAPPVAQPGIAVDPVLERRARMGARWFFWIAGLSLLNSFMAYSGKAVVFIVGLGITQIVDATLAQMGADKAVTLMVNAVIASVFILLGVFALRRHTWAFIVGMILYGLDAPLAFLATSWLGLGFHVLLLFWIFKGLQASHRLNVSSRGFAA